MDDQERTEHEESSEAQATQPKRRIGRRIATLLVTIFLSLFIVELGLRIAGFSYVLRSNQIQGVTGFDARKPIFDCEVDRELIWIPPHYRKDLLAARSIKPDFLFLGDSCTEIGKYDLMLGDLLRTRQPQRTFETAKIGATGWSTEQGLRLLRLEGAAIKPRVVTFYYGWNDHWNSIGLTDREVMELNASPLFWFHNLRMGQLAIKARIGWQCREQKQRPLRVPPALFRENLIALVEESRRMGIIPVLITAPSSHEPGHEPEILAPCWVTNLADLVPLHQMYVNIVRSVAEEHDVILCDLAASFAELPQEALRDVYFIHDGIHLTDAGDRLIAEALYDCFLEHDLIK